MIESYGVTWPLPQESVYFVGGVLEVSDARIGAGKNQMCIVQISTSQCFPAVPDCFIGVPRIQLNLSQREVGSKESRVALDGIHELGFGRPEIASLDSCEAEKISAAGESRTDLCVFLQCNCGFPRLVLGQQNPAFHEQSVSIGWRLFEDFVANRGGFFEVALLEKNSGQPVFCSQI